jgi:4-hydroxy-3-methylbut-2-enyl diphosphate reductase
MRVIRAEVMGMCFGVRDALKVIEGTSDPRGVTILGQLVHNEVVLGDLKARGFAMHEEPTGDRSGELVPGSERVLITAHGISERQRLLESAGKTLIDTTCPLVARAHQAAQALQAQGYHVLVIGRKAHVEVQGIIGDLTSVNVIESELDVQDYARPRLGVLCQTTATERQVATIRSAIAARNPDAEIRYIDTICLPTKEHQRSLGRLLERVDAVVVVGGRNSNNTRELVDLCRQRGRPVVHVRSPSDLDPAWFQGFAAVGLTAGTSTLERTINEVHRTLVWIGSHDSGTLPGHLESQPGTPARTARRVCRACEDAPSCETVRLY